MIDTHCHIDFDEFDEDRKDVMARAKEKLNAVINSGYGLESNAKALALSKEYEKVAVFAETEGLTAHAKSARIRFGKE